MIRVLDDRDRALIAERVAELDKEPGPRVGDYVDFLDGVTRRISHVWDWGDGAPTYQTSDGGSFYLGDGYVSFSGGLHPPVTGNTLRRTLHTRPGSVWIFHHDHWTRDNGVPDEILFRVYACELEAPR